MEIAGTYGASRTPCTVYAVENRDGSYWYACDGSTNVNLTHDALGNGVDVETLNDVDTFTATKPIDSIDTLISQIDE